jgi:serine protease Do
LGLLDLPACIGKGAERVNLVMRRFVSFGPALVVLLTVALVLIAGPSAVHRLSAAQTSAQVILAQRTLDQDDILERLNAAVRNIAASVRPSVVHLEVAISHPPIPGIPRLAASTGTGWVYDDAGHIVTNLHVIRGARQITVQFANGRTVQAEQIHGEPFLGDPLTDVAVLKVPAIEGLFPLRRATGMQPQQGDRVYAFGSPFGFKFSMSEGIVSGLGRDPMTAVEFGGFTNFIQTDAAVNPGNSGGPLVDIRGRVIGMNVAIATGRESQGTTEGQSAGISFAIPLGTIESVVDQLIVRGRVSRGFLGIQWHNHESPAVFEESVGRTGFRIARVLREGPAEEGGLRPGDLITRINGQDVTSSQALQATVTSLRPGEQIAVEAWREGQSMQFTVMLGEYPRRTEAEMAIRPALGRYGLLLPEVLSERPQVRMVVPHSAAANEGFKPGQVILSVAGQPVSTVEEVQLLALESGLLLGRPVQVSVSEIGEGMSRRSRTLEMRLGR